MIDITLLRNENTRANTVNSLSRRGVSSHDIDSLVEYDEKWRTLQSRRDELRALKNETNSKIPAADSSTREKLIADMQQVAKQEDEIASELETVEAKRNELWRRLPNIPLDDVPSGGEKDFEVIITKPETPPTPSFEQKDYLQLMSDNIDTERAAKVSGSRFVYLKNNVARLEIGLVSFLFDHLSQAGFTPVLPPVLIRQEAMAAMGYLDQNEDEVYRTQDDLYLVGTSEQSIGPMHMNEVFDESQLPLRYIGFSPCFRREAGSHGKDVKGILRLHQFDKVEMFSFTSPAASTQEHEFLLEQQMSIMDALELPYRVIKLAAGDLGTPSAKTYDVETWIPSEGKYRETHSTSNTTDFQARRLGISVRNKNGTARVHMLNGTALAMSRILIALIENHQQEDGSIRIPAALHPYLPFTSI